MIWGEFINQLRCLHVDFSDAFRIHASVFTHDVELDSQAFPYPSEAEDFGDWNPPRFDPALEESLELHPVERVLMEGPLLPIHDLNLKEQDWAALQGAILALEKQWLEKNKLFTAEHFDFIEKNLGARFIQLQRRSGRFALKAI
jgi:hypothetical protein